jgi:hypothetical protein
MILFINTSRKFGNPVALALGGKTTRDALASLEIHHAYLLRGGGVWLPLPWRSGCLQPLSGNVSFANVIRAC